MVEANWLIESFRVVICESHRVRELGEETPPHNDGSKFEGSRNSMAVRKG
jgi:hypothetical protein